jgi:hypothetical protein
MNCPVFPARYSRIAPDSNTLIGLPPPLARGRRCGDLVVGRDLEEGRVELLALGDVDGLQRVGHPVSSRNRVTLWPLGVVQ